MVTGGDPAEQRRYGDHLGHDERYERTEEFLADQWDQRIEADVLAGRLDAKLGRTS